MADYYFDQEAADRAIDFFPLFLRHVKGPLAGQPFELLDFQKQIIGDLFGWKRADGTRRYRTAFIEIPRKNGKSTFAAGIALYMLMCDGEEGAEVYSAASTREQASLVYDVALQMCRQDDKIKEAVKLRPSRKLIEFPAANSYYKAIPAEAAGAHGYNAHAIIFDELHTQPNRELWDVLTTSTGARKQPLTVAITTAGHDRSSICYELHRKALSILAGETKDDTFYPVVFSASDADDWTSEEVWRKANPAIGSGVSLDYLATECEKAKANPAYENTFRNLHLNQWTEQEVRWLPMHKWDECAGSIPSDVEQWFAGMDLAESRDVPALVLAGKKGDKVYIKPFLFTPQEPNSQRAEQDKRQLMNWAAMGFVETLPGDIILNRDLVPRVFQVLREYGVKRLAIDPWRAKEFVSALVDMGYPEEHIVKFPQTITQMNEPTRALLDHVTSRRLVHDGNECLRWMASNVVVVRDSNGNIKPAKDKSQDKIDGIVAAIMAIREALVPEPEAPMPVIY